MSLATQGNDDSFARASLRFIRGCARSLDVCPERASLPRTAGITWRAAS